MAKFFYTLIDNNGQKLEGKVNAQTKDAALKKIRQSDEIILSIKEEKKSIFKLFGRPHLSTQDKMIFVNNLSTMIKVGVTLIEAFEIILSQIKKPKVKKMYEDILETITSGQKLASALRKYDYIFPDLFINMIETGEKSGNLEKVLEYLDVQLQKEYELRKKIVSAFVYPAVIIGITVLMALGITVFLMPKIIKIFKSFDIILPLPTRMLMGFSDFLTQKTLWAILLTVAIVSFFIIISKIKALKPFWDKITIYLPVFGKILISANVARFSRTINSLLHSGTPITEAINITKNMLDNSIYKKALYETSQKVEKGGKLGESLEKYTKIFPSMAVKMIYIGEKTGSIETTTERIAELYERDVEVKTRNLSTMLEPILLLFMGILVGGIALSIILPIYQLPNMLSK